MNNVLVTGGAGFIGSNFVRYLLGQPAVAKIANLDLLTYAGLRENVADLQNNNRHIFIQGDICDGDLIRQLLVEHNIDIIINFAAESHVDRSIQDPASFVRTNTTGTFSLLESARKVWAGNYTGKRFHHISTDEVYGELDPNAPASTENSPYRPRSPYAASKASADHLVRAYFHTYGLPVTVSICSNNFGPYQFPEKLIPLTILNALQGKQLPLYGDGLHTRDWVFVRDHCEAVYQIVMKGKPGEFYNVGGQTQLQNAMLVRKICEILDELRPSSFPYATLVTHVTDRPGHDRRYALDISRIQGEVGWSPRYNIDEGLRLTVKWYLEQESWTSNVLESREYIQWIEKNYHNRKQ
jgi:dTDP-glucose 4,6-dehydratase